MRSTALGFGYGEVQTPTFETTELFVARSGEAIVDEMYVFEDKGGRSMSLRPEMTAAVMRLYADQLTHLPKPLRVFYTGPCFRYERPQKGRYREFYQFGAELIGCPNPEADEFAKQFKMGVAYNAEADRLSWEELKVFLADVLP